MMSIKQLVSLEARAVCSVPRCRFLAKHTILHMLFHVWPSFFDPLVLCPTSPCSPHGPVLTLLQPEVPLPHFAGFRLCSVEDSPLTSVAPGF